MRVALALATDTTGSLDKRRLRAIVKSVSDQGRPVPDLPNQDAFVYVLVRRLLSRVEQAYRRIGVPPLPETVIGTLGPSDWNAFSAHFDRSTALVVIHGPAMVLYYLLAKAAAQAFATVEAVGRCRLPAVPPRNQVLLAAQRLAELACALAHDRDPSSAPAYVPPADWPFWNVTWRIVEGMELFVVAHEYGHLMEAHGRPSVKVIPPRAAESLEPLRAEFAADASAMLAMLNVTDLENLELALQGPLILMIFLDLMCKEGLLPAPVEHPRADERLRFLRDTMLNFPGTPATRQGLRNIVSISKQLERRLRTTWALARTRFGFSRVG